MVTWVVISKVFKLHQDSSNLWRSEGITSEVELYWTALGGLVMSGFMMFAGWFHYHKAAPKLEWFQNAESMMNHHLSWFIRFRLFIMVRSPNSHCTSY